MHHSKTAPPTALLRVPAGRPRPISRSEIERGIARGRRLQGEAMRRGFSRLRRVLAGSCSLRSLRLPAAVPGGRRQTCC